jgi:hypothetical protein
MCYFMSLLFLVIFLYVLFQHKDTLLQGIKFFLRTEGYKFGRIQPLLATELLLSHAVLSTYLDIIAYLAWVVSLEIHTNTIFTLL